VAAQEQGTFSGLTTDDLDLAATLESGQAFRWTRVPGQVCAFVGTVGRRRARLSQTPDGTVTWQADGPDAEAALHAFLRLDDADLPALATRWCAADTLFAEAWARQPGVRVLRQDPAECFFSFLCASVAPIARISGMLRAVAQNFGDPLGSFDGVPLFAFPTAVQLARADEQTLRDLGLGFRARRVCEAALALSTLPPDWVHVLRDAPYEEAKQALLRFFGVGEKIADCVCLFALDKNGAIPVDVHIWRIAQSWYAPDLAGKSLTPANYARAGAAFRDRFGPFAGWAQQTLFYRAAVGRKIERPRAPGTVTKP
jgi:N-glycosylase/DNA lyase